MSALGSNLILMFLASLTVLGPLAIVLILIHYNLRRAWWKRRRRQGMRSVGFCPSSAALGMALQFMQVFHRPSMAHVVEARQAAREEAADEDNGDPVGNRRHFLRQLRRIRRGEVMEGLELRM